MEENTTTPTAEEAKEEVMATTAIDKASRGDDGQRCIVHGTFGLMNPHY